MPVQRGGQLAVIAKGDIWRETSAGAHVVDHDDGNAVQVGEVMQLLENLQKNQQAKPRTLATGRAGGPLKFLGIRRVARL
ncbi:hypothetical protein AU476_14755 [Cupriavidus sp. UYMSc13B]|nr:hypothetical protein AU476_14755 [Cupriavidus sp. UYMSc13B]